MSKELEAALANPNAQKYLRMIAQAEGTYKDASSDPYRVAFGGSTFDDLSKHPKVLRDFRQTDGKANKTSAAGAYQFLGGTWDDVAGKLGLQDFGPRSQDLGALELIRRAGALDDVLNGRFDQAVKKMGSVWASLPSSPYAQPRRSAGFVEKALNAAVPSAQAQENPFADLILEVKKKPQGQQEQAAQVENPFADLILEVKQTKPERSFVERAGDAIRDIPRQVGLTARYGLEGVGQAAELVTEPVAGLMRAAGIPTKSTGQLATSLADTIGLPAPQTASERVVGDATRMVAGAGGIVGAGRGLANAGAQTLGAFLSQQPTAQLTSAAGSGLAGGAVRESGGSEGEQILGAVLGGLAGAAVPGAVSRVTNSAKSAPGKLADLVNPGRSVPVQQVDAQIKIKLEGSGVDWDAIPEKVRQVVRQDVQQALKVGGDLDGQALQRLVDFRTVGATPTRGTVTLDPVQITKEKNLAKMGANSQNANAQKLVSVESANNKALLDNFGRLGADRGADTHAMGERAVGSLQGWLDSRKLGVDSLYAAARDSSGRAVPLDGAAFTTRASQLLDEGLLGGSLPKGVEQHLNRIAMGEVPFDVNYAEQLKTQIAKLQRGTTDGSTRMALGLVRQALEDTPLQQGADAMGDAAIGAFNKARSANREMMQQIEKVPALKKLWDGDLAPDDFVRRYVSSPSAKAQDVSELVKVMGPEGKLALRDGVLGQLKAAATGGAQDELAKFSAAGFRRALDQIGDRKLGMLFSKEDVQALKALSRVSQYTTHQPVGSAVNNSNSGAMLAGKGLDLLNGMGRLGDLVKFAGIGDQVNVFVRGRQQAQALDAVPSIVRRPQTQQFQLRQLAAPAGTSAALFAAPLTPKSE
nr:MAG TPA: lysozyme [Caudoviricetes sp.]